MSMIFDYNPAMAVGRLFDDIVTGAASVFRRIRRRVSERQTRDALQALPDHILRDIGVSRSEINYLARGDEAREDVALRRALDSLKGGWSRRELR